MADLGEEKAKERAQAVDIEDCQHPEVDGSGGQTPHLQLHKILFIRKM